jgi:hypothetical protein
MIPKDEFIRRISKGLPLSPQDLNDLDNQYESAQEAAAIVEATMPSIGFFSTRKRINAFFAVCRHLDQLVEAGRINASEAQLSLMILRVSNASVLPKGNNDV